MKTFDKKIVSRFNEKFIQDKNGCWNWIASIDPTGYGRFAIERKAWLAHRVAYEIYRGEIPVGLEIDHLCRNRNCVNPWHLEPVTRQENVLRGISPAAFHAKQTHCKNGHEFTEDNIYRKKNGKLCLTCYTEYKKKYYLDNGGKNRARRNPDACSRGHKYTEETTYHNRVTGFRQCAICRDIRMKEYYQKNRIKLVENARAYRLNKKAQVSVA